MKRLSLLVVALLMMSPVLMAKKKNVPEPPKEEQHVKWLSMDELQEKMKASPKKVYMDIYTDWCGWCKVMESKTFSNPEVIKYLNANFYCVRFNAERKDTFRFLGTTYYFDPQKKANTLAANLMKDRMSYPTSIIMEERYQNPQPIPGYQDVKNMEMILKYFGDNIYKGKAWPDYQKDFKQTWLVAEEPAPAAPGH